MAKKHKSPAYCPSIYKGIFIRKESNNQARVSSCCINVLSPLTSVIDFENNDYLKNQRRLFEKGLKPKSCNSCWIQESKNLPSRRTQGFLTHIDNNDPLAVELTEMHYNVAPLCNAKCITCDSTSSSSWAAEDAKFDSGKVTRIYNDVRKSNFDLKLDYTKLRQVYFNGGEPFLSEDPNTILSTIKQQIGTLSNIGLVVNTNASIMPSPSDVMLWNECASLTLICSIEAVESQFEYIRYPLNWKEVSYNVSNFNQLFNKPITIMISPNLGIHNALEYPKLVNWVDQLKSTANDTKIILKPNVTFGYLSFDNVTDKVKHLLLDTLPTSTEYQFLRSLITSSGHSDNNKPWVDWLKTIDHRRGLDWKTVFPTLSEFYQST